ncbi:MAG: ATP-binding protein [Bacilli bacterium]|nr:ATP-binding protein [Bacilli bacterium]
MIGNLGKIVDINGNYVTIKIEFNVSGYGNLMNIHVVFDDGTKRIVGEILKVTIQDIVVGIVGELQDDAFIPGINAKPSFASVVRIINKEELELVLGPQEVSDSEHMYLGKSAIYNGYRINVGVNNFFSNHFAILGNTGSGKSCTFARIIQNIFTTSKYLPVNASVFVFDAYGEYKNAFSFLHEFNNQLNYKSYTTNIETKDKDSELLRIPLWLLDVDDIALLLGATEASQLPIIEKALKLVPILKGTDEEAIKCKNDIIARAVLDILQSGKDSIKIRDQITAVLSTFHTDMLSLESQIIQPGYVRTLKQCIYVDNSGKMQEMELVVNFISTFIIEGFEIPNPKGNVMYNLDDLEQALNFALISEGILKSDKVFDYANILSVRLHALANGEYKEYFNYGQMVTKSGYIRDLMTTYDGGKAQLVGFNINYIDDRTAKSITKIISRLLFEVAANSENRGKFPFHIIIEEAHRYVQKDIDQELLGYNIFDRITKEGRKYGVILGLITQRPSELSETSISQCSNFIVLRTLHPKDLQYIKEMVPNVTDEVIAILKTLQPGSAIAFGSAFKVPVSIKMDKPSPEPYSNNSDVAKIWYALN